MSSVRITRMLLSLCSCLLLLVGLQGGDAPRCTLGIVVQEAAGGLGRARRRVAERAGEQRQLQVVDGAAEEGLRLVGWGAGRHGYTSWGSRGGADLGVVGGEGSSQFGSGVLKPHLRERKVLDVCVWTQNQSEKSGRVRLKKDEFI